MNHWPGTSLLFYDSTTGCLVIRSASGALTTLSSFDPPPVFEMSTEYLSRQNEKMAQRLRILRAERRRWMP